MSPNFPTRELPTEVSFRSANGERLTLEDRGSTNPSSADNIVNFALQIEKHFNINLCLTLLCATFFVWSTTESLALSILSISILILQCKAFISSVKQDTLLVVESIGVHIESKRGFGIFVSTEFLPWDTVEDVFINEVVKGQRVLFYLTFIVRETIGRQHSRRLVPLFQDLLPERKCLEYMYGRLVNLIGSTRRRNRS